MTIKFIKVFTFKIRLIIDKAQNSDNRQISLPQASRINEYEQSVAEKIEELERLSFRTVYKQLSWKYNFFSFYYPLYRAQQSLLGQAVHIQPDLLRPSLQFHVLQLLTSGFVSWIQSVFFTTLLQATYRKPTPIEGKEEDEISLIGLAREYRPDNEQQAMAGLTLCAVIMSTLINVALMDRVYARIYMQCLRIAFLSESSKNKFTEIPQGSVVADQSEYEQFLKARDQVPDRQGDGKSFLIAHFFQQKNLNIREDAGLQKVHPLSTQIDGPQLSSRMDMTTQVIDSTRQLIMSQDDFDRVTRQRLPKTALMTDIENIKTDLDKPQPAFYETDRLLFLENIDHPGEVDLLQTEALHTANQSLVSNFTLLFLTFTLFSAISCFLNYKLEEQQAVNSFIMFCCSFLGDHFVLRPLFLILLSLLRLAQYRRQVKQSDHLSGSRLEQSTSRKQLQPLETTHFDNAQTEEIQSLERTVTLIIDMLKLYKRRSEFEEIQRLNMLLIQKVKEGYGERGIKVLENFRGERQKVLRKHYLQPVFNPIFDYSDNKVIFGRQLRAPASVDTSQQRTEPVAAQKVKLNPKDQAVQNSLLPSRTNKALSNLNNYKSVLKDPNALQYATINKDKKPYFKFVGHNMSMEISQKTDKEDSIVRKRSGKGSVYTSLRLKAADLGQSETLETLEGRQDSSDLLSEEYRLIQDLEVKIFELGNSCDENGISPQQKVNLTQFRLQRAKIKRTAAQRKAQKEQMDADAQKYLEEMNEEMEQFELEALLGNLESLTQEQRDRLNELRQKKLSKLRAMINQKNPSHLSYDETLQLKELIDCYKVSLSPLEQHRLQEQLKRHNLFSKRDYDMVKIQEYRYKLKATGPSAQFELKDAQRFAGLIKKHQVELPEDEWITWRDTQRKLGLLSKEELQIDMIAQLRAHLKDTNYRTTFQKVYLNRLIHLLDKVPVQLTPEEQERLLDMKVKFNALTPQDKEILEFRRIQQKLLNSQPLTKKEQKRYAAQSQKPDVNQSINLTNEQVERLKEALQTYPLLSSAQQPVPQAPTLFQQHQNPLNHSMALRSEQSVSVQDDPVVFRTIDELMASKKCLMMLDANDGSLQEDSAEGIDYSKDEMTQYSKALGLVNKRRGTRKVGAAGKKKGKKKGSKRKAAIKAPGAIHYDIDAEESARAPEMEDTEEVDVDGSLEDSLGMSEEEVKQELTPQRSLFELQVQKRASSKNPTPTNAISENMKGRLETLHEIYSQELKKEFSSGVRLSYQSQTARDPSPVNRQATNVSNHKDSTLPSLSHKQSLPLRDPAATNQTPKLLGSADTSVTHPPASQETQALVQYESNSQGEHPPSTAEIHASLQLSKAKKLSPSNLRVVSPVKEAQILGRFIEEPLMEGEEDNYEDMEGSQIYRYSHTQRKRGYDPGNVAMISSGKVSATSTKVPYREQQNDWARRPAGYYRELSLKQITEAMGSGGSSKSSVGAGKNGQPPMIPRDIFGSRETRAKSQQRSNRYTNDQRRKRMQTLGEEITLSQANNESPMKKIGQVQRRKIQSSADNRLPQQNFILQQDNLVMASEQNQEEEYYYEEGPTETQYTKDEKMQKVKVKRKRGWQGQRRQREDYESPYAEYLLGAIKDAEGSQKRTEIQQKIAKTQSDAKFKRIKSIYNDNDLNPRAGRAQSPITSAMLMIHPIDNSSPETKQPDRNPDGTFGGRQQARTQNQTSSDFLGKGQPPSILNPFFLSRTDQSFIPQE